MRKIKGALIDMIIRENISTLKNLIQKNIFLKLIIIISTLIYPTIFLLDITDILSIEFLNPMFSTMWIGFYSSIILMYFVGVSLINILLVLINVCIILFFMFASLMGGIEGPLALTIKMILPFIPLDWLDFNWLN
ncbi:hypothetical protein GOQ27_13950 [Clostridium sp. D2Q-11]|uniref:Uncharacterized protein n=1 Tax=Anaeromonas frigoriresistens TaxID=2683708 RepID=A0A942Z9Q5_9FIRM|nr:hypothetical protein [Anaeromonas frigoriresistens]MBS4539573.1 hypothetical protein [Anaeromonas frigoriresistens]